ncbi:ABC transporter substrate-binding protein [Paenibacillus sp. IB182496]|uniref:ABC transporter substrate-binding protein n=1 Tax=Paenibacillus sabuli TaxID=2772509 RepID=A0A927GQP8_9BACL|nr:ABC transporter substrate-binding protein [Paenibacillus sabuli]MBD2843992.1 ABC transporter substrate-binding protein [Paenibacillus sabuli]
MKRRAKRWAAGLLLTGGLVLLAACGAVDKPANEAGLSESPQPSRTAAAGGSTTSQDAAEVESAAPMIEAADETGADQIDWETRRAHNREAGTLHYMTGYYYTASPPDIQAVLADELGYFEEMGLEVDIQPGLESDGIKLLAAGQLQLAASGTPSAIIQSVAAGSPIRGVATFSATGISALMVMADSGIETAADLKGRVLGYHGALPANFLAMLEHAGVGADEVESVSVGYDPTILAAGKVDALTVYKSNEPYLMEQAGYEVRLLDPGAYGAETSFGVIAANEAFAAAHPTAVEDFLRAVMKAHAYAADHPKEALAVLAKRSENGYDKDNELNRWSIEQQLVETARHAGYGYGWHTAGQWEREIEMLRDARIIEEPLAAEAVMTNTYIEAIYAGEQLIWPAS